MATSGMNTWPRCTIRLGSLHLGAIVDTAAVTVLHLTLGPHVCTELRDLCLETELLGHRACRCSALDVEIAKKFCKVVVPIETSSKRSLRDFWLLHILANTFYLLRFIAVAL